MLPFLLIKLMPSSNVEIIQKSKHLDQGNSQVNNLKLFQTLSYHLIYNITEITKNENPPEEETLTGKTLQIKPCFWWTLQFCFKIQQDKLNETGRTPPHHSL